MAKSRAHVVPICVATAFQGTWDIRSSDFMYANMPIFCKLWFLVFVFKTAATSNMCEIYYGYLEVEEGKQNNVFNWSGLTLTQDMTVQCTAQFSSSIFIIGTCNPPPTTPCTPGDYPEIFSLSRTSDTAIVTVNEPKALNKNVFSRSTVFCQTYISSSNIISKMQCPFDYISPATGISCSVEFDNISWGITGRCDVSRVRSSLDRYYCLLYQVNQLQSIVYNFTMSTTPVGQTSNKTGVCQINAALPPAGKYSYSLVIVPGQVQVSPTFIGNNEIRHPSETPRHNCPQYVTEGEDLNCLCYSDDLGLPSGSLVWRGTNSSKLEIEKVNRTFSGTSNMCYLMWNKTAVQNVIYTAIVNYASRVLNFQIDGKSEDVVNVRENTNVSVVCQAEGRPLPTIRLFKRSSDIQDLQISVTYNTSELRHTMITVQCMETASYSCGSENVISGDQKYILLIVSCSPKKVANDSYVTTFVDDKASLMFQMIAFPSPKLVSIFYIGSSNDSTPRMKEHENTGISTCSFDKVYSYMITCTVTLHNKTVYATGFYTATFSNILGNLSFPFEVKERIYDTTQVTAGQPQSQSEIAGTVAGGVIGAVVFIVLAISIVVFIIRRKRKRGDRGSPKNLEPTSKIEHGKSEEKLYDQLQRGDINSPSIYQTLGHQQTPNYSAENKDQGKSTVYELPIELQEREETSHTGTVYQNSTFS